MHADSPNVKLYSRIFCWSALITVCAVFFPASSRWFTVIAGIGCGGIASTIVAWLIESANYYEKEERCKAIYASTRGCLEFYVSAYAPMYYRIDPAALYFEEKHTWIKWNELLISKMRETPKDKVSEELIELFEDESTVLLKELQFISSQKSLLMIEGLISKNTFVFFSDISQKLELCRSVMKYGTCNGTAQSLSSLGESLAALFRNDDELKIYNDIEFHDLVDFYEESEKNEYSNQSCPT